MATNQINARDWVFQVLGSDGVTWIDIAGVNKFTLKRSASQAEADTTVFTSGGTAETQAMQRGADLTVEGRWILTSGNVRDPGQLRIEALGFLVGESSLGQVRFRHVVQTLWTVWAAWVSLADATGGNNDKTSWGFTANKSGVATTLTAP